MTSTAKSATPDPLAAPEGDPPPLMPAGAASTVEEQLAILQKQMSALLALQQGQMQLMAGVMSGAAVKPTDEALQAIASVEPLPTPKPQPRIRIVLEDNENIPPGGQFVQVNGMPYMLQPNMEMDVPVSVLDVLDHAVMSVPVKDDNMNVIGYRDRLRFPYRVIRNRERDIAQREADEAEYVASAVAA
jgi:hypothetical protein